VTAQSAEDILAQAPVDAHAKALLVRVAGAKVGPDRVLDRVRGLVDSARRTSWPRPAEGRRRDVAAATTAMSRATRSPDDGFPSSRPSESSR
jgi:hypothetical protein